MAFNGLLIVIILNALATIALWRTAARRPEKLKEKFVTALLHSEPVVPKHQRPTVIGEIAPSLVDDADRHFFNDFEDFADVLNWWLGDERDVTPWRLQELPATALSLDYSDMPQFGRRYDVYHNQVRVGVLEISPDMHYSIETPSVHTNIRLEWVRLLSIDTIRRFLGSVASHVSDPNSNTQEYVQARATIEGCLTNALWQAQQVSEYELDPDYGAIELQLNGSAMWYFQRRQSPAFKRRPRASRYPIQLEG